MEYEFIFVVEGASVDDTDVVDVLVEELDALLFRGGGVDLLTVASEGEDAFGAAIDGGRTLSRIAPQLRLLYLDRELVGMPEIAERTGVTRQNVHQWINGSRRGGVPFPRSEGTAGRSQAWLWVEVNAWLAQFGLDDGVSRPTRHEMAEIDAALFSGLERKTGNALSRWRRARHIGAASFEEMPIADTRAAASAGISTGSGSVVVVDTLAHE